MLLSCCGSMVAQVAALRPACCSSLDHVALPMRERIQLITRTAGITTPTSYFLTNQSMSVTLMPMMAQPSTQALQPAKTFMHSCSYSLIDFLNTQPKLSILLRRVMVVPTLLILQMSSTRRTSASASPLFRSSSTSTWLPSSLQTDRLILISSLLPFRIMSVKARILCTMTQMVLSAKL